MAEHFLVELSERYPRLKEIDFSFSERDIYSRETTPAGVVEALYFFERQDFENAIIALAYKLERRPIPASTGAMFLGGLVDHVAMEKTSLVLLSRGGYSALSAELVGLEEAEWLEKSFVIRRDHELAHFVQRKLFPENKHALRDEVKADMVGIMQAYGAYRPELAKLFLGTEGAHYRIGGRLQNYVEREEELPELMLEVNAYIDELAAYVADRSDSFQCLIEIETREKEAAENEMIRQDVRA